MRFNEPEYHRRREREHRAQADAATTERVREVRLAIAEQHAARTGKLAGAKPPGTVPSVSRVTG